MIFKLRFPKNETRFSEVKEKGSGIKIELLISLTLKYLSIRGF
ncbi:hypothetical protein B33_11630 [Bacillus safensis]|nr:hypothetical protein B33_11630 [Bacillus safensis]